MPPTRELERRAHEQGYTLVAGVDEAGRGCLAGPVVAAAVILPPELDADGIVDSKLLTPEQRAAAADRLQREVLAWAVGFATAAEVDARNILRATHLAMARALASLAPPAEFALVDGLPVSGLPCPHWAEPRADQSCLAVAAASILAKVTRDRLMIALEASVPGYGFAAHKGYGTAEHLEALRRLGPCAEHRRSFGPVAAVVPEGRLFTPGELDPPAARR